MMEYGAVGLSALSVLFSTRLVTITPLEFVLFLNICWLGAQASLSTNIDGLLSTDTV